MAALHLLGHQDLETTHPVVLRPGLLWRTYGNTAVLTHVTVGSHCGKQEMMAANEDWMPVGCIKLTVSTCNNCLVLGLQGPRPAHTVMPGSYGTHGEPIACIYSHHACHDGARTPRTACVQHKTAWELLAYHTLRSTGQGGNRKTNPHTQLSPVTCSSRGRLCIAPGWWLAW
jgi:hypothetical protein